MSEENLEDDDPQIDVEYVRTSRKKEIRALIAQFSNSLAVPKEDNLQFSYYKDPRAEVTKEKSARLLVARTLEEEPIEFVGSVNNGSTAVNRNTHKTFVGVLNKETKKLVIYSTQHFLMRPALEQAQSNREVEVKTKTEDETFVEKRDHLSLAFGTVKTKKMLKQRIENAQSSSTIESFMKDALDDVEVASALETSQEVANFVGGDSIALEYLPKFDADALEPKNLYPLDGIISDEEMAAMSTPAKVFIGCDAKKIKTWLTEKTYCAFVCKHLKLLPENEEVREQRSILLMYFHYLYYFYSLKAASLRKKDFLPEEMPHVVKKKLTEKFTISSSSNRYNRSMPPKMKDSLLFHMFVLSMIIEKFELNIYELNNDFPRVDLTKYFKMIGCRVTKAKNALNVRNNAVATLKPPLDLSGFENHRKGNKRKRGE